MQKVNVYVAKYELIKTIQFIYCDTRVASGNTYKSPLSGYRIHSAVAQWAEVVDTPIK